MSTKETTKKINEIKKIIQIMEEKTNKNMDNLKNNQS
jgi:hypothetical protein